MAGITAFDMNDLDDTPVIAETQATPDPAEPVKAAAAEAAPTAKELQAAHARVKELEAENRFWAGKAKGSTEAPAKPAVAEPDDVDKFFADAGIDEGTAAELLDEIGEKGVAALSKRGLVTKSQLKGLVAALESRFTAKAASIADSRVSTAKGELTAEAKLMRDYPEFGDEKSEFYKTMAKEFSAMAAEDASLNSYAGLRQACRMAKLQLGPSVAAGGSGGLDRVRQIAAQSPSRGAKPTEFGEDDVEITAEARQLIAAAGRYGVTEKSYKEAARNKHSFIERKN